MIDIDDPRSFATRIDPAHAPLFELARATLAAVETARADEITGALSDAILERLRSGRGALIGEAIAAAPSPVIARALWRSLIAAWARGREDRTHGVAATLFALPIVIVAGRESGAGDAEDGPSLPGVLPDTSRLAAILRSHGALGGSETFALGQALVAGDAIDVPQLAELLAWQRLADTGVPEHDLQPTPIALQRGQQGVHLRFLIGAALAAPGADLLRGSEVGRWGMPLALELARQVRMPGVSVLALPRAPQSPPAALPLGRDAQREVGAQLFASNAIRRLRGSVGEPVGVISAHRCADSPGGGELRLSLSSPFDPRQAEGFRCPLFPTDRAGDVATMLFDLLRDCRVTDVRVQAGVHPDRDPKTGMVLLFKPGATEGVEPTLH